VQGNASDALAWLVEGHAGNQTAAEAAGAMRAVVDAMHAHPASEGVQYKACRALEHLAGGHAAAAVAAGGVEAVAAALQMLPAGGRRDSAHRVLRVLAPGHALLQGMPWHGRGGR
jgi:hypothetical protein